MNGRKLGRRVAGLFPCRRIGCTCLQKIEGNKNTAKIQDLEQKYEKCFRASRYAMSFTNHKYHPPPPAASRPPDASVFAAEIAGATKAAPGLMYGRGYPLYVPNIEKYIFPISFAETPFTYLNMSANTSDPTPQIIVRLSTVPIGSMFFVTGPEQWDALSGIGPPSLHLMDLDETGSLFPNNILEVGDVISGVKGIIVLRDETGLVGTNFN